MEDCSPSVGEVSWFVFIAITIIQTRLLTKHADVSLSWFWDPRWCLPWSQGCTGASPSKGPQTNPLGTHQLPQQLLSWVSP